MPFNDFVTVHLASIVRTLIPPCDRINRLRRLKLNYDCGVASSAHQQRISDTNPLHNEKEKLVWKMMKNIKEDPHQLSSGPFKPPGWSSFIPQSSLIGEHNGSAHGASRLRPNSIGSLRQ
ncbi:hypothetical protein TNCV_3587101 [Trichonephila clavipes]|nr:hypothetical protein TNCV_3587101 [Trichonephila clavipes]